MTAKIIPFPAKYRPGPSRLDAGLDAARQGLAFAGASIRLPWPIRVAEALLGVVAAGRGDA